MAKKEYEVPEAEFIRFRMIDIITTSDENEGPLITDPDEGDANEGPLITDPDEGDENEGPLMP